MLKAISRNTELTQAVIITHSNKIIDNLHFDDHQCLLKETENTILL